MGRNYKFSCYPDHSPLARRKHGLVGLRRHPVQSHFEFQPFRFQRRLI